MPPALTLVRYAVFGTAALAAAAAFAAMAVQQRRLNPFSGPARLIRRLTDPLLKPIERRVLRSGGNPQSAPWWLIGIAIVGGIIAISAAEWLIGAAWQMRQAAMGGSTMRTIAAIAFKLFDLALIVRVLGSWIGASEYTPWMKPFVFLTEWLLRPIRRLLPRVGPIDFSPLVAWLVMMLFVEPLVLGLL